MAKKKKCKVCEIEFIPKYSTAQIVCSYFCSCVYAQGQREKKEEKNKKQLEKTREEDRLSKRKIDLQKEIQKLARLIDTKFGYGCCCCYKPIEGTGDGAHYHNKGGNENIKFNLDNVHRSRSHCNQHNSEHKKGYKEVMRERYGEEYSEYLENGIRLKYKEMHFTSYEIDHALKTTRKIIREFDTFDIGSAKAMREYFNKMIGLYK